MLKLSFSSENEFNNQINFIVKRKMGNGVFLSKKMKIEDNVSNYLLGIYVPKLIEDMKSGERRLKFLRFNKVSSLEVVKERGKIFATLNERDELCEEVDNKISSLLFNVENILLDSIYENLTMIPLIQISLNPIKEIFINVHKAGYITHRDLIRGRNPEKVMKYIKLLKDLEFIRIENNRYIEGNKMIAVREMISKEDYKSVYNKLLSIVIQQGYGYIRKYLNIMSITPYLRWITSYYYPSLQYSSLLNLTDETLRKYYDEIYNIKRTQIKARNQINHIIDADILERDGKYIIGKNNTFIELSKQIHF